MMKPRNNNIPKNEPVNMEELVKDPNAGEIDIPKVEPEIINTPMGTTTVEIVPGKKVKVIGKDGIFAISQKLNNGKVSLLGPEGLILYVEPEDIRNVK